jgi:hypothetical protein
MTGLYKPFHLNRQNSVSASWQTCTGWEAGFPFAGARFLCFGRSCTGAFPSPWGHMRPGPGALKGAVRSVS